MPRLKGWRKPDGKTAQITVRLRPDDKERLLKQAQAEGLSLSDWIVGRLK